MYKMVRREKLSDLDLHNRKVIAEAVGFKVVLFKPQSSVRDALIVTNLKLAIENATSVVKDYRCAMIYAFDKHENYVMVGQVTKLGQYVENKL